MLGWVPKCTKQRSKCRWTGHSSLKRSLVRLSEMLTESFANLAWSSLLARSSELAPENLGSLLECSLKQRVSRLSDYSSRQSKNSWVSTPFSSQNPNLNPPIAQNVFHKMFIGSILNKASKGTQNMHQQHQFITFHQFHNISQNFININNSLHQFTNSDSQFSNSSKTIHKSFITAIEHEITNNSTPQLHFSSNFHKNTIYPYICIWTC